MRNNTPNPWRPQRARGERRKITVLSALVLTSLAVLLAVSALAFSVPDTGSDTLQLGTKKVFSSDEIRIEVHTGADGKKSEITIHGDIPNRQKSTYAVHSSEVVRIGESVTIHENQLVQGDVVAVLGDVTVHGRVEGDVVAVMGTVFIKGSGVVDGDAVGIGGGVRRDPGALLAGENVAIRFIPGGFLHVGSPSLTGPIFGVSAVVFFMFLLFLFGWLVLALGESHVRRVGAQIQEHLWKSLFTGMAAIILSPFAFVLLLATIVGIPLALILPVVFPLAHLIGFIIVAGVVGMRLVGKNGTSRSDLTQGLAIGLLFFLGIMLIGQLSHVGPGPLRFFGIILTVFGIAASFVAATIGLGAMFLSRFGMRPRPPKENKTTHAPSTSPGQTHPLTSG